MSKIGVMGRKKLPASQKTPRVPVQIPKPWCDVARKLAAQKKQPLVWYLMDLLAEKAKEMHIDTPPLPWEEGDEEIA